MTRLEFTRLAKEAGFNAEDHYAIQPMLMQFAGLVARQTVSDFLARSGNYLTNDASREAVIREAVEVEREACAIVAEQGFRFVKDGYAIADDIRARGAA